MEIYAKDRQLGKILQDDSVRERRLGTDMAKKLEIRLAALQAAEDLAAFWPPKSGPERCHELKGQHTGIFSIDLKQPYRLLFKPLEETPQEDRSDEQRRWTSITEIEVVGIEDTHG